MFDKDQGAFNKLAADPAVQDVVDKVLKLLGDQSKAWELNDSDNIEEYID